MAEYRVNLEIYNGPLVLLLYLFHRSEVDIQDIQIAAITEQYLQYISLLEELNIDNAGEFLVMAATLMEIKSNMLLPRPEVAEGDEGDDFLDPRMELVRQLLEYKKFKDAAGELNEAADQQSRRFARGPSDLDKIRDRELAQQREIDLEQVQIWDLFDAFSKLMKATLAHRSYGPVIHDDTPIDLYEARILQQAQNENPVTFTAVFGDHRNRGEMIGLFLALLELMRLKLVRVEQDRPFSKLIIFALTDEPAEQAVAHAVSKTIDKLPSLMTKDQKPSENDDDQESHESP